MKIGIRALTLKEVRIDFNAIEEEELPSNHFECPTAADFDETTNEGCEQYMQACIAHDAMLARIERAGSPDPQWFCAKVTVSWMTHDNGSGEPRYGYSTSVYLGCCSYESYDEFKENGDYRSMVDDALDKLNDAIAADFVLLRPLMQCEP